jgi:hypothetical protein
VHLRERENVSGSHANRGPTSSSTFTTSVKDHELDVGWLGHDIGRIQSVAPYVDGVHTASARREERSWDVDPELEEAGLVHDEAFRHVDEGAGAVVRGVEWVLIPLDGLVATDLRAGECDADRVRVGSEHRYVKLDLARDAAEPGWGQSEAVVTR